MSDIPELERALTRAAEQNTARRRRLVPTKPVLRGAPAIVVGGALLAGLSAGAVAGVSRFTGAEPTQTVSSTPPQRAITRPVRPQTAVPPAVQENFGAFRRPRRDQDVMPANAQRVLKRLGASASLSRRVGGSDGPALFAVPGRDTLCVIDAVGGSSCSPTDRPFDGDISTAGCAPGLPPGSVRVFGLISDGPDEVLLADASGATTRVPIVDNGFVIDVVVSTTALPVKIQWTRDGRSRQRVVPIPERVAPVTCG